MGIYDRDYYRDDRRSIFDPFTARTQVTTTLVIINVVVWFVQVATRDTTGPNSFTNLLSLDVDRVKSGEFWRIFTSAFLHDPYRWGHIVFNMLFLWWAGGAVEDIYGSREFLAFYLGAVLLTGGAYFGFEVIAGQHHAAIGASGAVTAVLMVFACHYPRRTIYLFFLLPVPVWFLVAFQVVNDTLGVVGVRHQPVAYVAHLAGAGFGFLYHSFSWRVLNWLPALGRRREVRRRAGPKLTVYRSEREPEPEPAATGAGTAVPAAAAPGTPPAAGAGPLDEHLEAKLDEVLEKVQRHGKDSLSESEREILVRASEIYRRRRQG